MATATKEKQDKEHAEFAAQFDAPEAQKSEPTEDEAFGLSDPAPTGGEGATTDTGAADAAADTDATASAPGAADSGAADASAGAGDKEKELADREAALSQREADLAAREAAIGTTNAGETQSDGDGDENTGDGNGDENTGGNDDQGGEDDPGKLLADDFGPDFVHLLTRFIKKICETEVGNGIGSVSATVDAVISHLQSERQANHFKAIAAAHDDFQEIVESPAFSAWKESQSPEEQTHLQRVIDSGSAQEIIDMLTDFKKSRGTSSVDENALDDAEGVRSGGGLTLPKEPAAADDYAQAWANA
jgi:hypothetical protein